MNEKDAVLGFFTGWVNSFAKKFDSIMVICLETGEYIPPSNVKVLSLGKEEGKSRFVYLFRFYKYIISERKNYDAVFVHMNQEYVILGWKTWFLFRKNIYMWRNHHAGNITTNLAAFFCKKIFCTSKYSYTARFKKTVLMPIGVDLALFKENREIMRKKNSILFLARMAPVKKPDILLAALQKLHERNIPFTATFCGDALPKDKEFYESLMQKAKDYEISQYVEWKKGIPNSETPTLYNAHEIFVNLSSSGMYDKTIVESAACGTLTLASNKNLLGEISESLIFSENDIEDLALKIENIIKASDDEKQEMKRSLKDFTLKNSLENLAEKLKAEIK